MPEFTNVNLTTPVEPNEADWADLNLADLEVLVRSDQREIEIWQAPDDTWWRRGGVVYLRPSRDGVMRFVVWLRRGANMTDYQALCAAVVRAKDGKFARHGWEMFSGRERSGWLYAASRPYDDPYECRDRDAEVFACVDNRCTKAIHEATGDDHVVDTLEGDGYDIEVTRYVDTREEDTDYSVFLSPWETFVSMSPEQVASLVSDMQWAAEACRHANATPIDSTVKGIHDPTGYWERRKALECTVTDERAA